MDKEMWAEFCKKQEAIIKDLFADFCAVNNEDASALDFRDFLIEYYKRQVVEPTQD